MATRSTPRTHAWFSGTGLTNLNGIDRERDTLTNSAGNPRLLLLVTTNQRRGAEVFGEQLAGGLTERGWDVAFHSLVRGDGPKVGAAPLVDKDRADLGGLDLDVVRAVRRVVRRHRPDLVFANGSATLRYGLTIRLLRGRPRLVYGSIGEPMAWAINPLTRFRTAIQLRLTDLVTSVSAPTRAQIVEGLGIPSAKVVVAPTGVPVSFADLEHEPPADHLRVLLLGSVTREKGPDVAVRAVQAVAADHPIVMRVVGGGDLLESLRAGLGPADPVEFTGPTGDVRPHLAWADVLLLASRTEGLPGVVLEAAAAGVPAVAFDVGGVSDVVRDGVTGLLAPRGDEQALTAALRVAAADRGRLPGMGKLARELVLDRFTLDHAFDRYDEVFRSVLAGHPPKTHRRQ